MLGTCNNHPLGISLVMPMQNAAGYLEETLPAILSQLDSDSELILVDDGSRDDSLERARKHGVEPVLSEASNGPAAARNLGCAKARGDVLLFIDADVQIPPDLVMRVRDFFSANPNIAAVFGSYDDQPRAPGTVSQYKNLLHHFVHQQASEDAVTFWSGCGAVRRKAFEHAGGFDAQRFPPLRGCEDIDLGLRLRQLGYRIQLKKEFQVTHLKDWSLFNWIKTDVLCRAIPWTILMYEYRDLPCDLNVKWADRVSALLACLGLLVLAVVIWLPGLALLLPLALMVNYMLNRRLYHFFKNTRGLAFGLAAFFLHQLYYTYSAAAFAACTAWCRLTRRPRRTGDIA